MTYLRPICAALALALGLSCAHAGDPTGPVGTPPRALENPLADMSLDPFSATRERPLFLPDRRRPVVAPVVASAEPPPPPPEPPKLSLFGVIVDTDGPRAFIRAEGAGKIVRARLGDDISGWRVAEIEQRRVIISHDTREVAITMFGSARDAGGNVNVARVHPSDRVYEVNAAGVLRSHRIHKVH